ncbi:hypothetical protein F4553_003494 [Allocatelliglobosispora scoriae]|uniref:SH3 domain-containing protein n=1 Tax=Allocatelliglobosispora scoriae TaxID=643052 RepID=A0A841BQY3_9ACTN|nr:SH3 domain-containing protein [Allocatelliglobosispora scoriae]MBB5870115.1 hypothetical protein [Allocatelliglobosispora scoriae]
MRLRMGSAVAAVVLAAGTLVATTAAPASASACDPSWGNYSAATATVAGDWVNYRTGAWLDCSPIGSWQAGSKLYLHCWRTGSRIGINDKWWHARKDNTQQQGWISAYYIGNPSATNGNAC